MNCWSNKRYLVLICVGVVVILTLTTSAVVMAAGIPGSSAAPHVQAADQEAPAQITFTKWVTSAGTAPVLYNMEGVVSGTVGGGKFVGEILDLEIKPAITKITALYHINGGTHQVTARVHVTQDNNKGTGMIQGVVTDGWLKGARVEGGYQVISPCGIINAQQGAFGDVCFQGTIHLGGSEQ